MDKRYLPLLHWQLEQGKETRRSDRHELFLGVDRRARPAAALLLHNDMARSAPAAQRQQLFLHLQRRLGNTYVQGIVDAQRGATHGHAHSAALPMANRQMDDGPSPEQMAVDPAPPVSGTGEPHEVSVFAPSPNVRLRGRTRARFNGGNFRTENVVTEPGSGCKGCRGKDCIHVAGTVVTEYRVTTTVTLPRASDFRGLTRCQRERVQDAIDGVLAPHEQQHVDAFETYNGTTDQPFDVTLCRTALPRAVRKILRDEETPRRAAAQAASDALDPFNFDVDLDCED